MTLNSIINNRIGLGRFQVKAFLILCLVDMNDGVQLVLTSFLNPIIKAVFSGVTTTFISMLASMFYVGSLFGSLISGHLADIYGRRKLIQYGAIMQFTVALLFYYANSLTMMLLLRFMYGFSYGFTVAITTSMFAEITPQKYRGKGILLINFCISIGKLYGVALGYIFIQNNIALTNWKLMMICGGIPNIVVLLGSQFVLTESPRFLLANKRFQQGVEVLNKMIRSNKGVDQPLLTFQQQEQIRFQFSSETLSTNHSPLTVLFSPQLIKTTTSLLCCWIAINFCFYGQLTIEALHISGPTTTIREGLSKYFFTVFGELPSLFLTLFMIDHPVFGRRNSLILFFGASGIFHLIYAATTLTAVGSIARFFMKDVFQVLYPLTTESFETKIRTKGFGFCSGGGRMGAIIMPFILLPLDQWSKSSVYILFCFISFLASYTVWSQIPQTMNKSLDKEAEVKLLDTIQSGN